MYKILTDRNPPIKREEISNTINIKRIFILINNLK